MQPSDRSHIYDPSCSYPFLLEALSFAADTRQKQPESSALGCGLQASASGPGAGFFVLSTLEVEGLGK